ncbi:DUF4870 domain-containing protein [Pseudoclavibacter helvolus]|uniref:DUF4870 domain-containing protein n=1 Tax=Pseudoclavibacter helvolus TaxID=255205 RepID=UPI003C74FBA7
MSHEQTPNEQLAHGAPNRDPLSIGTWSWRDTSVNDSSAASSNEPANAQGPNVGLPQQVGLSGQDVDPYAQTSDPYAQASAPHPQSSGPHGQFSGPHGQFSGPHGQFSGPQAQSSAPRAQSSAPHAHPANNVLPTLGATDAGAQPTPPVQYVYVAPSENGTKCWALGFIGWIPIPILGMLAGALTMWFVSRRVWRRSESAVARENARVAANWAATMLLAFAAYVVFVVGMMTLGSLGVDAVTSGPLGQIAATGVMVLILAVGFLHVIASIAGTVTASQGRVFTFFAAIPFLKAETLQGGASAREQSRAG